MISNLIDGLKAYLEAYQVISRLKLWRFFMIPMLISVLIFLNIVLVSISFSDEIGLYISSFWSWDFGKETINTVSMILGGIILISIGLILFKHLVMILSAPFMGPISKKIEDDFTGVTSQTQVSSPLTLVFRSIKISSRNLFRELLLSIPILILGLIPLIGFFSLFLLFLMQAYFAGFGNMDYTLERHFSYQKSIQFVKANKGIAIGNGLVFMLFLLIPFVGIIFIIPFSVTSATIATVKIINQ
ncbi:EI24 domain-containing protein [Flavobacteriaceae bacterium]|jgi:CysZ protein|nr:EI24 domain-containing protein [Flavobacteriaceae bacterium]